MTTTHQPPQFSGEGNRLPDLYTLPKHLTMKHIMESTKNEYILRKLKRIKEENRKERYKYVVRYILHGHSAAQVGSHPLVRGDR